MIKISIHKRILKNTLNEIATSLRDQWVNKYMMTGWDKITVSLLWLYWFSVQTARFMWPTWGLPGSCRPHMGPMLAPWTLLSGYSHSSPHICSASSYLIKNHREFHDVKFPWIFLGALLNFNGDPGNIQGNLDRNVMNVIKSQYIHT